MTKGDVRRPCMPVPPATAAAVCTQPLPCTSWHVAPITAHLVARLLVLQFKLPEELAHGAAGGCGEAGLLQRSSLQGKACPVEGISGALRTVHQVWRLRFPDHEVWPVPFMANAALCYFACPTCML